MKQCLQLSSVADNLLCSCTAFLIIVKQTFTRVSNSCHSVTVVTNKLIEKSRECQNLKPQPTLDAKRKRKRTKPNTCKTNKQMHEKHITNWGARWISGRVSDSGARGPGFETYRRRVVSLSKTLYSPKVLVNYSGSDGSVPT